jgi:prophage regulatory protein
MSNTTTPIRFVSFEDLRGFGITYCRSQLWRKERDGKFPRRVPVSEQRIAWVESEIAEWQQQRIKARNDKAA